MPIVHRDRIRETTTITGTGTVTLLGASTAFRPFSTITAAGTGTLQFYYTMFDTTNFECGLGTYLTSTTFSRTTVISSSNSNNAVNWSSGTKAVILSDNSDFFETYRSCCDVTLTAGENLYQNDSVIINQSDGKVYRLNPELITRGLAGFFAGFVVQDALANEIVQVRNTGYIDTLTNLTAGKVQYAALTRYGKTPIAYVVGGRSYDNNTAYDIIEKITFSTNVTSAATTVMSGAVSSMGAVSQQITSCYFAGGQAEVGFIRIIRKILFATDVVSNLGVSADLDQNTHDLTGLTEGKTKGYFTGGYGQNIFDVKIQTNQFTFSTETTAAQTTADLSQGRRLLSAISDGEDKGFICGGDTSSSTRVATADKITFTTDVNNARTTANISQARYSLAGSSEGRSKGYFAGGDTTAFVATSDLTTFSTETTAANTASNLSQARGKLGGTSEGSTKGYFIGGGTASAVVSTADLVTFATDITASSTASNLTPARWSVTAGGCDAGRSLPTTEIPSNSIMQLGIAISSTTMIIDSQGSENRPTYSVGEKGFFLGGFTTAAVTTGDKLTFSTDTTAAVTASNLSVATQQNAGLSDGSTAGYTTGGATTSAILNKTTFSNDTTASITSTTKTAINRLDSAAVSNLSVKGYFLGGRSAASTLVSTTNKFHFPSETNVEVSTGNLSTVRDKAAGISEGSIRGYVLGGASNTTPTRVATGDRITFTSDTTSAVSTSNLSQARDYCQGNSFPFRSGYIGGGNTGAAVATADKLTYSNETTAALTTANLSQARSGYGSFSDSILKGFFAGGITTAAVATGDRLLFSTEVTAAATTSNLSQARYYLSSFSDVGV